MRAAMRRMIGSAVSVLCACLMPAIHAQKAASSPPLAATDPQLCSTADEYLELLHLIQQGDRTAISASLWHPARNLFNSRVPNEES
jgi:hypothetical protein